MTLLADQIASFIESSSFIRRMFETGIQLKQQYGADNVFDFSLGNPDVPPPPAVREALKEIAADIDRPLALGYMPNAGYPELRERLAEMLRAEQEAPVRADHVVATCGAAGALNALFRAILNPGDEVICPAPYFVEYGFYVSNYGGTLCPVPARDFSFELDVDAIDDAIGPATRAVLIDSPNNPTGQVYTSEELEALSDVLRRRSQQYERPIYLVSDEPYRFLTYDGISVPPILPFYKHSVVAGSFSKSLSIAGERIGYLAVNPGMGEVDELMAGVVMTNRILGFVSAPAIAQKILLTTLGTEVDAGIYRKRRDAMAKVLTGAGIEFSMPKGAFYFFPRAPGGDDGAFVDALMQERILAVPGAGFGMPGYFRLTFCVDRRTIKRSADGFKRAVARIEKG